MTLICVDTALNPTKKKVNIIMLSIPNWCYIEFIYFISARDLNLFTILEQIKQEQGNMKDQLCEILGILKNRASSDMEVTIPENLKIPLQCAEEVKELETALHNTHVLMAL
ncbi:hypothetical protein ACF0H5_004933 [Mactra antiquata]